MRKRAMRVHYLVDNRKTWVFSLVSCHVCVLVRRHHISIKLYVLDTFLSAPSFIRTHKYLWIQGTEPSDIFIWYTRISWSIHLFFFFIYLSLNVNRPQLQFRNNLCGTSMMLRDSEPKPRENTLSEMWDAENTAQKSDIPCEDSDLGEYYIVVLMMVLVIVHRECSRASRVLSNWQMPVQLFSAIRLSRVT